jgi:hypothetical protein
MLIKVLTELPGGKTVALLARIFENKGDTFVIRYLSPTEEKDHGCVVYRYEDQMYDIDDDSITAYLGTDEEEDVGFRRTATDGFVRADSDSDYVPSSEEESDSDESDEDVESDQESYVDEE